MGAQDHMVKAFLEQFPGPTTHETIWAAGRGASRKENLMVHRPATVPAARLHADDRN
jgi:hypothetical protein